MFRKLVGALAAAAFLTAIPSARMVYAQTLPEVVSLEPAEADPEANVDLAVDNLDEKVLTEADDLIKRIDVYIQGMVGDETLDRVSELRVLRSYRTQLTSYESLLRESVDAARASLEVINRASQNYSAEFTYLGNRTEEIDGDIARAEQERAELAQRAEQAAPLASAPPDEGVAGDGAEDFPPLQPFPDADDLEEYINSAKRELSDVAEQKTIVSARLKGLERLKEQHAEFIETGAYIIRKLNESLARVDEQSGYFLQAELERSKYTSSATYVFGVLVGAVIVGFFLIAFFSAPVRTAIFAGDSGIQFVTLFSLVIAIILFGVLEILEGKELAALLGGLSGYILGRSSGGSAQPSGGPAPAQPAAPNGGQA